MSLSDERANDLFMVEPLPSAERGIFSVFALMCDTAVIVLTALLTGLAYHATIYGSLGPLSKPLAYGIIIAVTYALLKLSRGDYGMARYALARRGGERDLLTWTTAFVCVLCISFLAKTSELYSRGAIVVFFGVGLLALPALRLALGGLSRALLSDGRMVTRRTFLVGSERDVLAFHRRFRANCPGLELVGSAFVHADSRELDSELSKAVAKARMLTPDDIIIAVPWADHRLVEHCIDAFMTIPAAIHLAPERILDRFDDMAVAKLGPLSSLQITRPPHHASERLAKRLFDIVAATAGIIILAPLLAVVAVLIKFDSPGPVLFFQNRFGFNQKTFRIFKFRTMTTLDDGQTIRQATRDDQRVTRIGRLLRRYSIDELPQLFNVLIGDMSIVGPRPHAVAHNHAFERRISLYARRHNVKPGITGWAQVNGLRGETDTDDKMRRRVEHDLYYIDNWSLLFDLRICVMTLISPSTFKNAY